MTDLGKLVMVFVGIIVGIALLGAIADNVFITNNPELALEEEVALTSVFSTDKNLSTGNVSYIEGVDVSLANDKIFTVDAIRVNETTLVEGTDFTIDLVSGKFRMLNTSTTLTINWTSNTANFSNWNYTHGDTFVQDSVARTFLNLILLFFVLALVLL